MTAFRLHAFSQYHSSNGQHRVASCMDKLTCRISSKNNPTCLHKQKSPVKDISRCTNICKLSGKKADPDHAMILPVLVRHASEY